MALCFSITPAGIKPRNSNGQTICRRSFFCPAARNSTPRKTSGNICARPTSQTASSQATKASSTPLATPGTSFLPRTGASAQSLPAHGPLQVSDYAGWYNTGLLTETGVRKIKFDFGSITLEAELLPTPTAEAISKVLPFEGEVMRWGE